jgi:putative OPT family oligopeptide transporter
MGKGIAYMGTNLSPALLGVGYIVGLNVGIVVVGGGILSWNIAIPIYSSFFLESNAALAQQVAGGDGEAAAFAIWSSQIRYLGVGAMLIGGLWTLFALRSSLLSGVRSGLEAARSAKGGGVLPETERDMPMKAILIGLVLFTLPLLVLYQAIVKDFGVSIPMTIIMIVAGFLFSSVSAYMAGLVGSSNNPVSGITIGTILFAAVVLLLLMGRGAELGPVAAIVIGAVVCCAAAVAGDNLQDLKCGYMIGATPWRQQVMLAVGAASCALIMAPVLNLLVTAFGIGPATPDRPQSLLAPQATLMASVAKGMFGGELPWNIIWTGVGVGAVIIAADEALKRRGAKFRIPVLGAAVGIYLPLDLTVPIFLGGLMAHLVERASGSPAAVGEERLHRKGVLYSAGLITGEALMGIIIAIPIAATANAAVLALPAMFQGGELVGLVVFALIGWLLYRTALGGALEAKGTSPPPVGGEPAKSTAGS